jgi:hypothetical protein
LLVKRFYSFLRSVLTFNCGKSNQTQVRIETKTKLKRILFNRDSTWKMFNFQKSTINMKWNRKKKTKTRKTQLTELNRNDRHSSSNEKNGWDTKKSPVELNTMNFLEQVFLVFCFLLFHFFVFHQQKTSDENISQTSTQTVICFENLILIWTLKA